MQTFLAVLLVALILFPVFMYIYQAGAMDYYTEHGRTAAEIEVWLTTRKWYNKFKKNIMFELEQEGLTEEEVNDILSGERDKMTIGGAFAWNATPEGTIYWAEREKEFLKWYYGQIIDFHLFK